MSISSSASPWGQADLFGGEPTRVRALTPLLPVELVGARPYRFASGEEDVQSSLFDVGNGAGDMGDRFLGADLDELVRLMDGVEGEEALAGRHDVRLVTYWRAARAAREAGHAWNGALDRLASRGLWPGGDGVLDVAGQRTRIVPVPPAAHVRLLDERVRGWPSAELHRLLTFEAREVGELVAREAVNLSESLVRRLVARPGCAPVLATNDALEERLRDAAVDAACARLETEAAGVFESADVLVTLDRLVERGAILTAEQVDRVLGALSPMSRQVYEPLLKRLTQLHFDWRARPGGRPR